MLDPHGLDVNSATVLKTVQITKDKKKEITKSHKFMPELLFKAKFMYDYN